MDNTSPVAEMRTIAEVLPATTEDIPLPASMDTSSAAAVPGTADTGMDAPPDSLPSTVDQTLALCPRFRILVVGNSGVGKSSLIANIFNVDKEDIDIRDDRAGIADINKVYTSHDNPRFALHDSKGFEPGVNEHWKTVEKFVADRSKKKLPIEERLHALWLCIEAPRNGARLTQTADEDLLKLAISLKIPVIVAFTKFDLLFNQFHIAAARRGLNPINDQVKEEADKSLTESAKVFQQMNPSKRLPWPSSKQSLKCVAVSTSPQYPEFLKTLEELTEVTTRCLKTKETFVPWAVAQRIDPKQKVLTSINEGFKSYWRDMAKSAVFKDHVLKDCLLRIHLDIIRIWNFRDPEKLLTGNNFHAQMLKLIEPLMPQPQSQQYISLAQRLAPIGALGGIFGSILPPLAIALCAVGVAIVAIGFLYEKYRATPETAICLEAYIVDLTLFLHELFVTALKEEWQKPLRSELVSETLERYKETKSGTIHDSIRNSAPSAREAFSTKKAKGNIEYLIRRELGMPDSPTRSG